MATSDAVTIFGLGFTGRRLARRLLARGIPVAAAVRDIGRFSDLADEGVKLIEWSLEPGFCFQVLDKGSRLFHSIPTLPAHQTALLHSNICAAEPSRVVYISSTGVYGGQSDVDENTQPAPDDERSRERIQEEAWLRGGKWSHLILRAAAIYGPGRGIHRALREGRIPRGAGTGVVSRIHVDDLASLAEAALSSDISGAWPVADDLPSPSCEIIEWCARHIDQPDSAARSGTARQFDISGRRVNGRKIRELLGVELKYPTWRTGIPSCIEEESRRSGGLREN